MSLYCICHQRRDISVRFFFHLLCRQTRSHAVNSAPERLRWRGADASYSALAGKKGKEKNQLRFLSQQVKSILVHMELFTSLCQPSYKKKTARQAELQQCVIHREELV